MKFIYTNKYFLISFTVFIFFNIGLYAFILFHHSQIPFNQNLYIHNSHHYFQDPRIKGEPFNFLRSLGQYDAQWYLKIANDGYPKDPKITDIENKQLMSGPAYAFFPLYPLIIKFTDILFHNIELSAFIISNFLLIINFLSLFYVISKLFSGKLAVKTIFLLFFFPFSIFFRSYFSEGIYLFFLIWFSYFLIKKNFLLSAIFLSALNITKGNGIILSILFLYYFLKEIKNSKAFFFTHKLYIGIIPFILFMIWAAYCYSQTGNPFYFFQIQKEWSPLYQIFNTPHALLLTPFYNLFVISNFPAFPLHHFHTSKIDILIILGFLVMLVISYKKLNRKLWLVSFILWLAPLLVKDPLSYSRYQIVSFPIFIYLSTVLSRRLYIAILVLFLIGLLYVSLLFVNWYWIG